MDKKNAELMKNTFIIFFSKFCTQFLSFLILPLVTSRLSTSEYGSFDLINTYGWLIVPYMSFQVENGIFRFLIDRRDNIDGQKNIITNGILVIIIQCLLFSLIYFPLSIFFNFDNYLFIYLYAISTLFLNIPLYISRGLGDNINYAIASIITGFSNVLLSLITVYFFGMKVDGLVLSLVLSNVLGGTYLYIKKQIPKKMHANNLSKKETKELLKYSVPLVPNMTSSWITNVSDKMMISIFLNASANGIYSICTKFSILLSHVFSVFNVSWTESASVNSKEKDRDEFYSNTVDNIFKICSCICILMMAMMPIAFNILVDSKFDSSYVFIPILILASIFEMFSGILGGIYISLKFSKKIALSTFGAGIINLLINLLFMKKFGIIVACISTLVSYFILSIYRFVDIKRYIKLKLNSRIYIMTIIVFLLVTYQYYKKNVILCLVSSVLVIIYAIIINKKMIIGIKNKIFKPKG